MEAWKVGWTLDKGSLTPNQQLKVNQIGLQMTTPENFCWKMTNSRYLLMRTPSKRVPWKGVRLGIHMLCKANVQRQPSVLMFFGIKLHDCALLSKMCKCVNYAQTDCQCKLKKWKIWCALTVRVQGVACCLMWKAASKLFVPGVPERRIQKEQWNEKQWEDFFKAPLHLNTVSFTGMKEVM